MHGRNTKGEKRLCKAGVDAKGMYRVNWLTGGMTLGNVNREGDLEGRECDCGGEAVGRAAAAANLLGILLGHLGRQLLLLCPRLRMRETISAICTSLMEWRSAAWLGRP